MFHIFEQPWTLLICSAAIILLLMLLRAILPDKWRWWYLILPIITAVAGIGADILVNTDPEKIIALIKTGANAVEAEDADAIGPLIAENYRDSFHYSRRHLLNHCRSQLAAPLVENCAATILNMDIQDTKAMITFTARIIFEKQSYAHEFARIMQTKIEAELIKQASGRWLIIRLELITINHQPAGWDTIGTVR